MADERIIIIDDEAGIVSLCYRLLSRANYDVHGATVPEEGLQFLRQEQFDLLLVDIPMPGMDGFQVAKLLQGAKKSKDIPIIFLTAISKEIEYREKGYELGAASYLTKPIDPEVLKQKIAYVLKLHKLGTMAKNLQKH